MKKKAVKSIKDVANYQNNLNKLLRYKRIQPILPPDLKLLLQPKFDLSDRS